MHLPVLTNARHTAESAVSATTATPPPLRDHFGRGIGYLRLSLTKACAMRCLYCRPAMLEQPRDEPQLTPGEIEALVRHLAERHGLSKVRLTGGDPTSRREFKDILARVARVSGIDDLAITTNGLTLRRHAQAYADAGLKRLNISLDTLDPERFATLTGVDQLDRVIEGIDAAKKAGLDPVKLNTVVVRDRNESDLPGLVHFAADRGLEARFIELMPMGPLAEKWAERYVPEFEIWRALEPIVEQAQPLEQGSDAARRYRVRLSDGRWVTVGVITPMSCNFCANCNRIRIASDGTLYPCLMDEPADSLLPAVRPFDGELLDRYLADGLAGKRAEHPHDGFVTMTHIGG
jgi:cyclic pyranopterin phosphate synthase